MALWAAFLLPIAVALPAYRSATPSPERHRCRNVFILFVAIQILALLGAGVWYVSEPLIQMSLYRFSIFPKLLSCIAAAWLLTQSSSWRVLLRTITVAVLVALTVIIAANVKVPPFLKTNALPIWLFSLFASLALLRPRITGWGREVFGVIVATCVVVSLVQSWPKLGILHAGSRTDDAGYLAVCAWARDHTPQGSIFLVPPDEQSFRLHAQRAIVVNFKNVPQLSGELGEWRDRLQNVLALDDIRSLPRPFYQTLAAIRLRYAQVPTAHLVAAAKQYGARYVLSVRPLDTQQAGEPLFWSADAQYFLYDLQKKSPQ